MLADIANQFKTYDKFATPIALGYDGKKGKKKSLCGVFASYLMWFYLLHFFIITTEEVMDSKLKGYSVKSGNIPPSEVTNMTVSFEKAGFNPAFVLSNQIDGRPIAYDDDTKKIIRISGHIM